MTVRARRYANWCRTHYEESPADEAAQDEDVDEETPVEVPTDEAPPSSS